VANSFSVTASNMTVTLTVNGTVQTNKLTLTGIQVQATEGGAVPASGAILRSSSNPGSAAVTGLTNDVTAFGSLSQAIGVLRLFTILPGQSFTDAATVSASGISGTPAAQAAGTAFNLVELVDRKSTRLNSVTVASRM